MIDQYYCLCVESKLEQKHDSKLIRYELLKAAEELLDKKSEISEIFNLLDQFRLVKKILLNKNQCFMLENREIHNINNTNSKRQKKELLELQEEKFNKEKFSLKEYLLKKKNDNSLTEIDKLLLEYLNNLIKEEVEVQEPRGLEALECRV